MTDSIALSQFRTAAAVAEREEAFTQIVRTHAHWMYNAALRQIRDPAAAEEATQATFIVLAKKAAGLREDTSLTAWLAKVLQLCVLRVKRDHARRKNYESQAAMNQTIAETAQDPADTAAWRELAPLLDEAVAKLSKTDREAILLRFYRQLPYAEMASALAIGEDAARKRVDRAVERLRGTLGRRGVTSAAGAAALAALLWSNTSSVAAPPGLVGTATTLAFATPATAASPAAAGANAVSTGMTLSKFKITATFSILTAVGLAGSEFARRSLAIRPPATAPSIFATAPAREAATSVASKNAPNAKAELAGMQGEWVALTYSLGSVHNSVRTDGMSMTVAGDRMAIRGNNVDDDSTITLDPSHDPKRINFRRADGFDAEGIYEWQGDVLRIRSGRRSELRDFKAGPNTPAGVLMEFARSDVLWVCVGFQSFLQRMALVSMSPINIDGAVVCFTDGNRAAQAAFLKSLARQIDFLRVGRADVRLIDADRAVAISTPFDIGGQQTFLGAILVQRGSSWLIQDLKMLKGQVERDAFIDTAIAAP